MNKKKRILLLGATGSIGSQTLDILEAYPEKFELIGIAAGSNQKKVEDILNEFPSIQAVGLARSDNPEAFKEVEFFEGENAMAEMAQELDYDLLVNATVGFRGLKPTLAALERGIDVALANKESLVAGGDLVNEVLEKTGAKLYPIDSEHSAIFQCLQGNDPRQVARLIITASGGSFRDKTREELTDVTVEQALAHPNWAMGKRITIDSATMVNKGFEVMEAHHLFHVPYKQIDVVLHPQSIVHSMVEYDDHATMAQLGSADMHLPIQYALFYPERLPLDEKNPLDMAKSRSLDFKEMDFKRYPMLKLAYEAGKKGGNQGAVFNGADEQAVELFLNGKISFLDIEKSIEHALNTVPFNEKPSLEELEEADLAARKCVRNLWKI